ncbi:MAG: RNA polymerase sigma factor [Pseudonocardiaceae bacterium]
MGPEQRVIDADTAQTLWSLVAELSPLRRTLLRALFTDNPRPYTEIARSAGIPPGEIGPTRARALQQLRRRLDESGLGPSGDTGEDIYGEPTDGERTGSHLLDELLDKAERALREKIDPNIPDLGTRSPYRTGDAQLDELLHKADITLREKQ